MKMLAGKLANPSPVHLRMICVMVNVDNALGLQTVGAQYIGEHF